MSADHPLPPGTMLRNLLEERGITPAQFAGTTGLGLPLVTGLLAGTVRIDGALAAKIALVTGTSGQAWLNAQRVHDYDLERRARDAGGEGQ